MPDTNQQRFAFSVYYLGMLLLVASLPLSVFVMSVSQFMMVGGWLLDGNLKTKFANFFKNKLAMLLVSLYLLHVAGLLYTSDFEYAFKDLRIKLPLLILPLLFSTGPPLSKKQFQYILIGLIAGTTISTLISFMVYQGYIHRPVNDIRDISIFISHIRLALLCCLSIFVSVYLIVKNFSNNKLYLIILIPVVVWLLFFLALIESLTGIFILTMGLLLLPSWLLFEYGNKLYKITTAILIIVIPVSAFLYIRSVNKEFIKRANQNIPTLQKTQSGNLYTHDPNNPEMENGYSVWNYVCEKEMEMEWNKRSNISYNGKDLRNQDLKFTLIRFLTSKGAHKDSVGISNLSSTEVHSVESGIANIEYEKKGSLHARIHQVLWEIYNRKSGGDPSGHSVTQRFEFWKAAIGIIAEHPVIGVGTGDVPKAFKEQYIKTNSPLALKWRLRAHNQYLSIGVAFGIIGIIWFLITLIYPVFIYARKFDFLYISFAMVALISMFTEDTLETQAGITFFALFNSLLLFVNPLNKSGGVN